MVMKLCSACLLGLDCKYNGGNNLNKCPKSILEDYKNGLIIPVCPEQLGGLQTPRTPAEIQGMSGEDVLDRKCKVLTKDGQDISEQFIRGAHMTLQIAKDIGINEFIGVPKSPSCGCGLAYDGSFTSKMVKGDGVTIALLKRNGIGVIQ